jgi:hypothetical protein
MKSSPSGALLQRFFAGAAEHVFQTQLGVADPPLIDYVSNMLTRFVRWDSLHKVRTVKGRPVMQVADMVAEAEARVGDARREVHRHIGDFTLFWTGVFPEALRRLRSVATKDYFVDYCEQGKRAYLIASEIETADAGDAPGDLLVRLSRQFEMCAYGLREVRRVWELGEGDPGMGRPILIN